MVMPIPCDDMEVKRKKFIQTLMKSISLSKSEFSKVRIITFPFRLLVVIEFNVFFFVGRKQTIFLDDFNGMNSSYITQSFQNAQKYVSFVSNIFSPYAKHKIQIKYKISRTFQHTQP